MKIKPTPKMVLIKTDLVKQEDKDGFVIHHTGDGTMPEKAEVIAIGDKVTNVKVGDKILFKGYAMTEVHIDRDTKYHFIDEVLILGTYED